MDDLISRADAIEAFDPTHECDWFTPWIIETLNGLPSVKAVPLSEYLAMENIAFEGAKERPTGRWCHMRTVKTNGCPEHWLKCSACGRYRIIKMGEAFPDWCENCGADMRGEKNG